MPGSDSPAVARRESADRAAVPGRRMPAGMLSPSKLRAIKALVWLLALLPFARLLFLGATSQFGANPLEFVTRSTGTWTLVLLCATLAVTPLRRLSGWNWLIRLRRLLGLFAFFYGAQHFLLWLAVDRGFDPAYMAEDVLKRPFITVGFAAFVLMTALALTSPHAVARWLGGKRWQTLHRSIYAIAVLAILHYWWHKAGKNDFGEVSIYAAVVTMLLGARLWWWRRSARQAVRPRP